jgi:hypothetical protein
VDFTEKNIPLDTPNLIVTQRKQLEQAVLENAPAPK